MVPAQPIIALKEEYRACREITHPSGHPTLPIRDRLALHDAFVACLNGEDTEDEGGSPLPAAGLGQTPIDLREYAEFNSPMYVLDILLPVINFRQEEYWRPSNLTLYGAFLRGAQWFYVSVGWFLTVIGAAGLSGIIRKD